MRISLDENITFESLYKNKDNKCNINWNFLNKFISKIFTENNLIFFYLDMYKMAPIILFIKSGCVVYKFYDYFKPWQFSARIHVKL